MSQNGTHRYPFESAQTRQTRDEAEKIMKLFLARLGVADSATITAADRELLLDFTTNCHLNISWYDNARKRQVWWYRCFVVLTGLLVLGTPLAIILTYRADSQALTAQVGVIIAGVLSAHRLLCTTLERRNLAHHFWKAQADLKSILYTFEDTWDGRATVADEGSATLSDEFRADLRAHLERARGVKHSEQEAFFKRYSGAFSNLAEIVGLTGQQATQIAQVFSTERDKLREPLTTVREQVAELDTRRQATIARRDQVIAELDTLADDSREHSAARKSALTSSLSMLHSQEMAIELELTTARTRLERLQHEAGR
ncbi:MAG: hypothetical protein AAGC55_02990 [Myxococcota bacterium]